MTLYFVEVAPNPTKVRLYIAEKIAAGATLKIEEVRVKLIKGEQKLPEHLRRNPFASLLVLAISPGDWVIESLSIMDYLEGFCPQPTMLGESARSRVRVGAHRRSSGAHANWPHHTRHEIADRIAAER